MTDTHDNATRFITAFNAHDEHAMRGLTHPNASFAAPGNVHLRGVEATSYAMQWLTACPDGRLTLKNELISGAWVAEELVFEGTHLGPIDSPVGIIPATGRRLRINAVLITRYESGLALETRITFDQIDLLTQLGAMPAPAMAAI